MNAIYYDVTWIGLTVTSYECIILPLSNRDQVTLKIQHPDSIRYLCQYASPFAQQFFPKYGLAYSNVSKMARDLHLGGGGFRAEGIGRQTSRLQTTGHLTNPDPGKAPDVFPKNSIPGIALNTWLAFDTYLRRYFMLKFA